MFIIDDVSIFETPERQQVESSEYGVNILDSLLLGMTVLLKTYFCARCKWFIWEVIPARISRVVGRLEGEGKEASKGDTSGQFTAGSN